MNRRLFTSHMLKLSGALALAPAVPLVRPEPRVLHVNGTRLNQHLQHLATFGRNASGGSSRVAFSEADRAGRAYVLEIMQAAGLDTHVDEAGNLVGQRAGNVPGRAPLMLGSHIDTVPEGGRYDGPVGVMAAIEVAHTLHEQDQVLRHPLEVVVFANEEGGKTGSRILVGEVMAKEFDLVSHSGKTIGEGTRFIGGNPDRLEAARRPSGSIAAYLEMHIEQGALLDSEGIAIGVVEGIVGIKRWSVTVEGFANHAGTTPMDQRQDALLAAARFIDAVNRVVRQTPGRQVGTVGRMAVSPGAPNVIPGQVELSLEIRDLSMEKIDQVHEHIRTAAHPIAEDTGTTYHYDHFYTSRAALTDVGIRQYIANAADDLGLSALSMPSGAGHDAQSIALVAPIGMIFVPSVHGISHSPNEFSRPDDITNGADVLLHTTLRLDTALE